MIGGANKDKVVENIIKSVEQGDFHAKVEVNDPDLSAKAKKRLMRKFWVKRYTPIYQINNLLARGIIRLAMMLQCRDVEIADVKKLKNLRKMMKTGAIVTSNHFSPLDNLYVRRVAKKLGRRLFIVAQESNLAMPGWIGFMMRYADILPIYSEDTGYMAGTFFRALRRRMRKKKLVLIYPEQEMWFHYKKPRPPKRGAFYYAAKMNVPVIPCFVEQVDTRERAPERKSSMFQRGCKQMQEFHKVRHVVHVLEPIYPQEHLSVRENSIWMMQQDYRQKVQKYEEVYGRKLCYDFTVWDVAGWMPGEKT